MHEQDDIKVFNEIVYSFLALFLIRLSGIVRQFYSAEKYKREQKDRYKQAKKLGTYLHQHRKRETPFSEFRWLRNILENNTNEWMFQTPFQPTIPDKSAVTDPVVYSRGGDKKKIGW